VRTGLPRVLGEIAIHIERGGSATAPQKRDRMLSLVKSLERVNSSWSSFKRLTRSTGITSLRKVRKLKQKLDHTLQRAVEQADRHLAARHRLMRYPKEWLAFRRSPSASVSRGELYQMLVQNGCDSGNAARRLKLPRSEVERYVDTHIEQIQYAQHGKKDVVQIGNSFAEEVALGEDAVTLGWMKARRF